MLGKPVYRNEVTALREALAPILERGRRLTVLEAGCGSGSHLRFGEDAHIVGIDISAEQLERNPLLHERILGDLETYPLPRDTFDVIVCWDVLEHLRHPERALDNFLAALAAGGIIVLAMPHVYSVKGMLTKLSPHWFHVLIYRYIFRIPTAGQPGSVPFPTYLRLAIAPENVKRFAARHGLTVAYFALYESGYFREYRTKARLTGGPWTAVRVATHLLTFGRLSADLTDYIIVLQKPATSAARQPAAIGNEAV
jgi:SAM-dependent methyltransferase